MRVPMLITAFLVYVFALPTAIEAGQAKAVPEVGVLFAVARPDKDAVIDSLNAALMDGLQSLGYVEGKTIHVELRRPRKPEDLAEMAADLVNRKVDVIATSGPQPIEAARRATTTIPIVIIACDRADRLVATIARPGGNISLHLVGPFRQAAATSAARGAFVLARKRALQRRRSRQGGGTSGYPGSSEDNGNRGAIRRRAGPNGIRHGICCDQGRECAGPACFGRASDIVPCEGNRRVCSGAASAVDVRIQRILRCGRAAVLWREPQG